MNGPLFRERSGKNAEHQRLEAEASEVFRRMIELSAGAALLSSVELAGLETELAVLGCKLASLHLAWP